MSRPPLVSIVTPSFNQGRFLRRTVDSVLRQTYPHIEYIVIDGGSTDDSVAVLESYGQRFWWISEPDDGQADAINKGFARSHGTICAYLNSDDVLLPSAVEKVVDYFLAHPDWHLIYGRANYIDADDRFIGAYPTAPFSLRRLAEDSCICQPAAFWRAELAETIGPFNAKLHYCMDYEYWLRSANSGARLQYVEDLLACSRLYPETKTLSGKLPMYRESIAVCRQQTGSVGKGPFIGMWRERLAASSRPWMRRLGELPGVVATAAAVHRWWYHCRLHAAI